MVEVSSLFARKAIAQAGQAVANRALARVGIAREVLADPANHIPVQQHHLLFETLAREERPQISFHMRT